VGKNCFFYNHARIKYSWTAALHSKQAEATGTSLLRSQTSNHFVFPLSLTESLMRSGGERQELSLAKMSLNFITILTCELFQEKIPLFYFYTYYTCNIISTTTTAKKKHVFSYLWRLIRLKIKWNLTYKTLYKPSKLKQLRVTGAGWVSEGSTVLFTWLSLASSARNSMGMQQADNSVQSSRQLFLTPGFI